MDKAGGPWLGISAGVWAVILAILALPPVFPPPNGWEFLSLDNLATKIFYWVAVVAVGVLAWRADRASAAQAEAIQSGLRSEVRDLHGKIDSTHDKLDAMAKERDEAKAEADALKRPEIYRALVEVATAANTRYCLPIKSDEELEDWKIGDMGLKQSMEEDLKPLLRPDEMFDLLWRVEYSDAPVPGSFNAEHGELLQALSARIEVLKRLMRDYAPPRGTSQS
jgi:hypothetical protein